MTPTPPPQQPEASAGAGRGNTAGAPPALARGEPEGPDAHAAEVARESLPLARYRSFRADPAPA